MESRTSNQTKARLLVLAIFVIGFAAGALSMNLYQRTGSDPEKRHKEGRGNPQVRVVKMMTERLSLTEEQAEKIKAILGETYEQYDAIRKEIDPKIAEYKPRFEAARQQGRERMREVLTPEQLPKFEEMIRERDRQREEEQQKRNR